MKGLYLTLEIGKDQMPEPNKPFYFGDGKLLVCKSLTCSMGR